MHLIADDTIDFEKYMQTPQDAAKIKPASTWVKPVIDRFYGDEPDPGSCLPWSKTHGKIKLRPGEVSVWAGVNGHGKSIMLNQVMLAVMRQGENVCIASMEMKPVQTMYRMTRQAIGVDRPSIEFIKKFHAWLFKKLWLYDQQGTVKSDRLIAVMRYCVDELSINHMVIDSLMKCGMGVDDYNGQKRFMDELTTHARDTGMHVHLVAHSRKRENEKNVMDKFDIKGAGEISDMVDNVFTLWRNKRKEKESREPLPNPEIMGKPDAVLICDKQRNGEWEGRIGLWFYVPALQFVVGAARAMKMLDDDVWQ